jgi:hypothetical protein
MSLLDKKRTNAGYLKSLAEKQQCAAIFEHIENQLCQLLKCSRLSLAETLEKRRDAALDPLVALKLSDFIKASRDLDAAEKNYQQAIDNRMKQAFSEVCE